MQTSTSGSVQSDSSRNSGPKNAGDGRRGTRNPKATPAQPSTPTSVATVAQASDLFGMDEILLADIAAAPPNRVGQFHSCRVCLGNNHPSEKCKYLNTTLSAEFMKVREGNYQRIAKLRRQNPRSGYSNAGSHSQPAGDANGASSSDAPQPSEN